MSDNTTVVLVGIGGYGELYLSSLLDEPLGSSCRIVGAVDPEPARCSRLAQLESLGVPLHSTLGEFYSQSHAELAVISSPIQLHADHTCSALAHGSHVLVEKPAAAITADVDRMIEARDRAGRFVAVGFQWSFSHSILELKQDIMAGRFGAPLAGRAITLWPRTESYYLRNNWAGKKRDADGRWVLDSPANNAMAHFLHNLLFLLGERFDSSANPVSISAHLARANDIETFDTIAAQVTVMNGVDLLFLASHAIGEHEAVEPKFKLQFEDAVVDFPGDHAPITAYLGDGATIEYESPIATPQSQKLWHCVKAISDIVGIPCRLETARAHAQCVEDIEQSGMEVLEFEEDLIRHHEAGAGLLHWVPGLATTFERAYMEGQLPNLRGVK